jgi:hypothetical protein
MENAMGQNNDTTEHGEPQGQQGSPPKISPEERKRQSGYPVPEAPQQEGFNEILRAPNNGNVGTTSRAG